MSEPRHLEQGLVNAFVHQWAADRYAHSRPYFHPLVISKVRARLVLNAPVQRALDVGCGTGQSTVALRELASFVVGVDPSQAMLAHTPRTPGLSFVDAPAEHMPFESETFDLMTFSSSFHWFDREQFLDETHRLLRPSAWLVIYDNAFLGIMEENPGFRQWVREVYVARYPAPPRDRRPLSEAEAEQHQFHFAGSEEYSNDVSFSPSELVDYLMTQSNMIAAVEEGRERLEDGYAWLLSAVVSFFSRDRGTFRFGGTIRYLQKH